MKSSTGGNAAVQFGSNTDKLAPVDFTGDGKTDVAFWRPSTGQWFVLRSEDSSFYAFPFGSNGDIPMPADFDGDGKADLVACASNSVYAFRNTSSGTGAISYAAPVVYGTGFSANSAVANGTCSRLFTSTLHRLLTILRASYSMYYFVVKIDLAQARSDLTQLR